MLKKEQLRSDFILKRKNISQDRRFAAEKNILELQKLNFLKILSFSSFGSEINTWALNTILSKENRLYLPKISNNILKIYQVNDLESQLVKSTTFNIFEPNELLCAEVNINEIECILVPALAFDKNLFRLGYGKGFYDKLLSLTQNYSIGVGFKEQLFESSLPIQDHDVPVTKLSLF